MCQSAACQVVPHLAQLTSDIANALVYTSGMFPTASWGGGGGGGLTFGLYKLSSRERMYEF